jgi:ribosomal-protein-alanine N-acetyltransferase
MALQEHKAAPRIRNITLSHLDSIIGIEKLSYPNPWPSSVFIEELQHKWSRMWGYYPERYNAPVGFILFWEIYDELHILNLAVHPDARRQGIARSLLEALLAYGREHGFRYVTLEVRTSNIPARNLYDGLGFKIEGIRRGYYSDNNEDALIMARAVGPISHPA